MAVSVCVDEMVRTECPRHLRSRRRAALRIESALTLRCANSLCDDEVLRGDLDRAADYADEVRVNALKGVERALAEAVCHPIFRIGEATLNMR